MNSSEENMLHSAALLKEIPQAEQQFYASFLIPLEQHSESPQSVQN